MEEQGVNMASEQRNTNDQINSRDSELLFKSRCALLLHVY